MSQGVADYFGTFLDTVEQASHPHPTVALLEVLNALAAEHPQDLWKLKASTGLVLQSFADAVAAAEAEGLVVVSGTADDEQVDLTPQGAELITNFAGRQT